MMVHLREMIEAKEALLLFAEGRERERLLVEIGDLYSGEGGADAASEAIRCYEEALAERPDDLPLLHKLRSQSARAGRWPDVLRLLRRCATLEKDAQLRGKLRETAAVILRDTLADPQGAAAEFELALDAYFADAAIVTKEKLPELLAPLSAIDQICAARKDWDGLADSYQRMLARMPKDGHSRARLQLLHALGEIHRLHGDPGQAIAAHEAALCLEPDNAARKQTLEALYVQAGGDYAERAEAAQRQAISKDPLDAQPYRNLLRLWQGRRADGAWLAAAALVCLQQATEDEARAYDEGRPRGALPAGGRLSDDQWTQLWHESEDRVLSSLLGAIAPAVGLLRAAEHRQLGLRRKERRDLSTDQTLLGRTLLIACQILAVAPPEAYFLPERSDLFLLANAREGQQLIPSIVAGAPVLSGREGRELLYLSGAFLTKLRPEHYLRLIVETAAEREVALRAALQLAGFALPVPPSQKEAVDQYAQLLRPSLRPAALEHLQRVAARSPGLSFDLGRWTQAVDLSSHRAGLLLSGDPVVAVRLLSQESTSSGEKGARERVGELLRFSVSPVHVGLRQSLGLAAP